MIEVLAEKATVTTAARQHSTRLRFFAVIAGIILLLVVSGFTPTLYLRPAFNPPPIPGYLYLHGIVLTSWFAWLFLQTMLIQVRQPALHRRLGVAGAVIAAAVPFAGLMATFGAVPRIVAGGISLDADASVLGIGVGGMTVARFVSEVVWGNIASAMSFAVLAGCGIALRRRSPVHKRLMVLASIVILGPALARLARLPIFGGEQGPFTSIVLLALLISVVLYDAFTLKRIHSATFFGAVFSIGTIIGSHMIAVSPSGVALVRWMEP